MGKKKNEMDMDYPQITPFEMILGEARYILLYGEIDEEVAKEINTKLIAMAIKNPKQPIILEINSPGGCVADGISIMNTIQSICTPVITLINGEACSMGGLISIVGHHRLISPNSFWMGHPMSDFVGGNPQTIKDRGIYLEKLEDTLRKIFKDKTKLSNEEFEKMLKGELWLSAEECLEKGIVDEIQKFPELKITKTKKIYKK